MFEKARLKLTAWYLLIIMLISILFSIAFYSTSARETDKVIDKIHAIEHDPDLQDHEQLHREDGSHITVEDLEEIKKQMLLTLVFVNIGIFFIAGFAGYFLAGRTLHPIKAMVDEQNQFISSASHELRTPIATLRAEMEGSLLEKHISDTQARDLIKSNLEELGSLQDLTNNLLQLAQVHNISLDKTMQKMSIIEVLKDAERKVTPFAKKKDMQIKIDVKDFVLNGDRAQIREVFVTLLDNAIKYSSEKSLITITSTDAQNTTSIHITDEGIGIAEKDLPHIFERFYRANKSRSQAEGFGLGLSIAKKIVALHNGSISVKSKEGKGTKFTVTFPHNNFS